MRIGLDFDGVVANPSRLKIVAAKTLFNVEIPIAKMRREYAVGSGLLTSTQYTEMLNYVYSSENLARYMRPVNGAIEHILRLAHDGHDVRIITSRGREKSLGVVDNWLKDKKLLVPVRGVGYGRDKTEACKELGIDLFVDDDLDKLERLVDVVEHRYLFGWEYNKDDYCEAIAKRVNSWGELYTAIKNLC